MRVVNPLVPSAETLKRETLGGLLFHLKSSISMRYDITKHTAPTMPKLGKGLECFKLLLSQTSFDMYEPLLPMLSPVLGAKISNAEFQYPSGQWLEMCGQQAALIADSAGHKAIAIPSATLLTKEVRGKMEEVRDKLDTQFHMYPDRDTPGERLFLQLQEVLPSLQRHQLPPDCKDYSEMYIKLKIEN